MAEPSEKLAKTSVAKESDSELLATLNDTLKRYTPEPYDRKVDTIEGRYKIDLNQPLPELNSRSARAYAVTDSINHNRSLFALVCAPNTLQRYSAIAQMKLVNHPHMIQLIAAGPVNLSQPEETRYVLIYTRPAGRKLSEVIDSISSAKREFFLCNKIIAPIASAINHLSDFQVTHGLINIDNIYFSDMPVLGDCLSEPCGYSQPFYYESLERMQALPPAKGEGSIAQDYYALAVLVLNILHGTPHFANMSQKTLMRNILKDGSYSALTGPKDVPEVFYDFFRGMLSTKDRWDWYHLKPWLDGKRYNVLMAPPMSEAVRPFEINGEETTTRREMAHLLYMHWDAIIEPLENGQLMHWVTVSLRDKDIAEQLSRVVRAIKEVAGKNQLHTNEQIMRAILLFDPAGPIRFQPLAFHTDGIDSLCFDLFMNKSEKELQLLAKFIEFDMVDFWLEEKRRDADYTIPPSVNAIMIKLDRLRICIRNSGFGFGLERMLYELNPEMPCQSPLLAGLYANSFPPMLNKLDQLASSMAKAQDPLDRHIAAYIAAKLGLQHEIHLHELEAIPALATHRSVIALKLLAIAQHRAGNRPLPGLTTWLAMRILPALDHIKSKSLRARIKTMLIQQAKTGDLTPMAELIIHSGYAAIDKKGYGRARTLFLKNATRIVAFRQGDQIEQRSARLGLAISQLIAYAAFAATLWSVLRHG